MDFLGIKGLLEKLEEYFGKVVTRIIVGVFVFLAIIGASSWSFSELVSASVNWTWLASEKAVNILISVLIVFYGISVLLSIVLALQNRSMRKQMKKSDAIKKEIEERTTELENMAGHLSSKVKDSKEEFEKT